MRHVFSDRIARWTTLSVVSLLASVTAFADQVPLGNVLRLIKTSAAPLAAGLEWVADPDALAYRVLRCDATAGDCVPSIYAPSVVATFEDTDVVPTILWYQVGALHNDRVGSPRTGSDVTVIGDGVNTGLVVGPGAEEDYFRVNLCASNTIDIDATFAHDEGNIDLFLYKSWGGQQEPGCYDSATPLSTDLPCCDPVLGNYDCCDHPVPPPFVGAHCDVFRWETNCPGPDCHKECCNSVLNGPTEWQSDNGGFWFDGSIKLVAESVSLTDDESISYTSDDSSALTLRVVLTDDLGLEPGNLYDLTVAGTDVGICVPDAFEPNDTLGTAVPMPPQSTQLEACPFDQDYYAVELATGESLGLQLIFYDDNDNLDMYLYDPLGVVVASATMTTGTLEDIVYENVTLAGTYTVQVETATNPDCDGSHYEFEWSTW